MTESIPVAGAVVSLDGFRDPLVVEIAPESEATRGFKNVARHVFRFVQEVRWAGGGAVVVGVAGDEAKSGAIAMNVGLLLTPLLDVAIEPTERAIATFEVDAVDTTDHPTPRDRLWLVPRQDLLANSRNRFGLVLVGANAPSTEAIDLLLVVVPHGSAAAPPPVPDTTEIAAVIVDAPDTDHPEFLPLAH
jgi:hypothetical protein